MAAERCPLCQSRLKDGECPSCGYRLPDEAGLSALYNYDPTDYPQEQPAVREITPEHQMEEIYPGRPEPIDFKVRNDEGKTIGGTQNSPYYQNNRQYGQYGQYGQAGQYGGQNMGQDQNGQPYQPYYRNNGQYGQYQKNGQYGRQNDQQGQPYQPYYGNNGQYGQYRQTGQYVPYQPSGNGNYQNTAGDFSEFFKKFWWLMLILFLVPFPFNIIVYALLKKMNIGIDPKFQKVLLIVIVLGIILPPY